MQAAVIAAEVSQVCVPCLLWFIMVAAGFCGLVAGSLYYGGATLQSVWNLVRQPRLGSREVALQGFERSGVNGKDGQEAEEGHEASATGENADYETQRLLPHERKP